jgi:hypothetical protein
MHQQIFITLPAKDLARTKAFWQALGYGMDPKFSGDNAVSVILGEHIRLMLENEETFMHFSHKAVCDTSQALEVLHALSFDSREHVDALIAKARAAGAVVPDEAEDHGFMYAQGFYDPDGHGWNCCAWSTPADC